MAVGKVLVDMIKRARIGKSERLEGNPYGGPRVPTGTPYSFQVIRAADMEVYTRLKEQPARELVLDVISARYSKDPAAIARLRGYAKVIRLPREGKAFHDDLPWKIVQQIGRQDIGYLMDLQFTVDGHEVRIISVGPGRITFGIKVEALVSGILEAGVRERMSLGSNKKWTEIRAEILPAGIKLDIHEGKNEWKEHVYDPNSENVSDKWKIHHDVRPSGYSGFGEEVENERITDTYEISNLNLRNIVLGLLKEIINNACLLGDKGR